MSTMLKFFLLLGIVVMMAGAEDDHGETPPEEVPEEKIPQEETLQEEISPEEETPDEEDPPHKCIYPFEESLKECPGQHVDLKTAIMCVAQQRFWLTENGTFAEETAVHDFESQVVNPGVWEVVQEIVRKCTIGLNRSHKDPRDKVLDFWDCWHMGIDGARLWSKSFCREIDE